MISHQHILAVFSPHLCAQYALSKALLLATKTQAKLTLIKLKPPKFSLTKGTYSPIDGRLEIENENLIKQYCSLGLEVEIKHASSHSAPAEILTELKYNQYDMVVANYKNHHPIFHEFFLANEWRLLRQKHISVMLVGDKPWRKNGHLLTAIETNDRSKKHLAFNKKLLDETKILANILSHKIHLVNCFQDDNLSLAVKPPKSRSHRQKIKTQHWLNLVDSAQDYHLENSQLHLEEGLADHIIPAVADQYQATMVIIGASEHHNWLSKLKGHTSEQIIDQLHCDILAIKPS
ncbi:universal stress protein [Shewanella sp. VB17]|uniref:universal stress protein n=1 Tax=Shewanella sp. VB17 TaxID=2739432 RepID=UPI0015635042|nr:universal stress protein [Shewanella sp. VB17]NRD72621.1 universal stress protein [Shewanella sp. VB17]